MNKTNFKLFTMFLAGIAFSAMTVLAATISISTNFEDGVTQYLKKLVILKNNNTTGMVLDGNTLSGENIYGTNITGTNIHGSSIYGNTLSGTNIYGTNITGTNISGTNISGNKIYGQSGLFSQYCDESGQGCKTIGELTNPPEQDQLWTKNGNDIYYTGGKVGIGMKPLNEEGRVLYVSGDSSFSGNITADSITIKTNGISVMENDITVSSGDIYINNGNIHAKTGIVTNIIKLRADNSNGIIETIKNKNILFTIPTISKKFSFQISNNEKMSIDNNGVTISGSINTSSSIKANENISAKTGYFSGVQISGSSIQMITIVNQPYLSFLSSGFLFYDGIDNNSYVNINITNKTVNIAPELNIDGTGKFRNITANNGTVSAKTGYFSGVQFSNNGTINFANSLKFLRGSSTDIFISGGNVGIGTTEPQAKLHVYGGLTIGSDTCDGYDDVGKLAIKSTGDNQECVGSVCTTRELVICSCKHKSTETERKTISTIYKNYGTATSG